MIVDLCLVLLLDSSGSVDAAEWELQARATAEALASPDIVARIVAGPNRRVAVYVAEWATAVATIAPWTEIASTADAAALAGRLVQHRRQFDHSTAAGDALLAAGDALDQAPACLRRVVDISSDGTSNTGSDPAESVAALQARGIEVNAVVIEGDPGVLDYWRAVTPGFVLPATWDSYAQAIRAKLALEIAGLPVPERPAAAPGSRYVALERIGGSGVAWIAPRTTGDPAGSSDVPVEFALALLTGGLGFLAGRATR